MQSQAKRLRWNSLFSSLSAFIRLVTNFAVFAGIARFYGAEVFGQFTTAHSLSTIFLLLADFGFDTLLSSEIARDRGRAHEVARMYFSVKLLLAGGTAVLMTSIPLWHEFTGPTTQYILVFSLYVFFSSLNNCVFAMFRGLESLQYETRISFWSNLLLAAIAVGVAVLRLPLLVMACGFVMSRVLGISLALLQAKRTPLGNVARWDLSQWRAIRQRTIVFGLHYLFGSLFFTLDSILLAFWKGDHEVGVYQSVFKIVVLALAVPDVIIGAILPVLSRFHAEGEERWIFLGQLVNKTLVFIALPLSAVLYLYSDEVIELIYGHASFAEAAPLLRLFALTIFVRFTAETSALMLTTSQRQGVRLGVVIAATVLNIALNAALIPSMGTIGAAVVSLVTNVCVGIGYALFARAKFFRAVWRAGTVATVVGTVAVAWLIGEWRAMPMWWGAPLIITVSVLLALAVGYTREERSTIFSLSPSVEHA